MSASSISFLPALMAIGLHIAGCAAPLSPEAQCFAEATVDYRTAWRAADQIRADLDRGYALHRTDIRQAEAVPCRVEGRLSTCLHEGRDTRLLPVAIDRPALETRLAALEAKLDRLRPPARARAAPCGYGAHLARTAQAQAPTRP